MNLKLIIPFLLIGVQLSAQDTLKHFNPNVQQPIVVDLADIDDTGGSGYLSGHNSYGDEEFAERYDITNSTVTISGVVAIHTGIAGTSSDSSTYNIYSSENFFPTTLLASKSKANNGIPIDNSPYIVLFDSSLSVSQPFFVSFNLGDYSHQTPESKRIAITHSALGTRPSNDFNNLRNVLRLHNDNNVADWKDFMIDNFVGYSPAVYFSLFPIIESTVSITELQYGDAIIGNVFPNPANLSSCTVPIDLKMGGDCKFSLLNMEGKILSTEQMTLNKGLTYHPIQVGQLSNGVYLLLIQTPAGGITLKIYVNR